MADHEEPCDEGPRKPVPSVHSARNDPLDHIVFSGMRNDRMLESGGHHPPCSDSSEHTRWKGVDATKLERVGVGASGRYPGGR